MFFNDCIAFKLDWKRLLLESIFYLFGFFVKWSPFAEEISSLKKYKEGKNIKALLIS